MILLHGGWRLSSSPSIMATITSKGPISRFQGIKKNRDLTRVY